MNTERLNHLQDVILNIPGMEKHSPPLAKGEPMCFNPYAPTLDNDGSWIIGQMAWRNPEVYNNIIGPAIAKTGMLVSVPDSRMVVDKIVQYGGTVRVYEPEEDKLGGLKMNVKKHVEHILKASGVAGAVTFLQTLETDAGATFGTEPWWPIAAAVLTYAVSWIQSHDDDPTPQG